MIMENKINSTVQMSVRNTDFISASEVNEEGIGRIVLTDEEENDICLDFHSAEAVKELIDELEIIREQMEGRKGRKVTIKFNGDCELETYEDCVIHEKYGDLIVVKENGYTFIIDKSNIDKLIIHE